MSIASDPAYNLALPRQRDTAVVFASPHSGREYPPSLLQQSELDEQTIRSSEDAYIDRLYGAAPDNGAPLLSAIAPRAFIDLNRAADEFDPALIAGAAAQANNARIASGLGVIPRVVAGGRPIYSGKLTLPEAQRRIGNWWRPYHDRLQRLLDESHFQFGQAILVDCHSMPHDAIAVIARSGTPLPDVVLGDRYGAAAGHGIVDRIEAAFASAGFRVSRNTPFAGAYIAQHYGRPKRNQHVVQIEIDRTLYMDEKRVELRTDFAEFQALISGVVAEITEIGRKSRSLAAE
jgi:N-formylglutamate amidohydrolase